MPVVADRAVNNDFEATVTGEFRSIHTNPPEEVTDWNGFIAWNDGHVTRDEWIVATRLDEDLPALSDNIFADDDVDGISTTDDVDAYLDHSTGGTGPL